MATASWVCILTDWSTPPEGVAWEADMKDRWTLKIDVTAEGLAGGVRDTGWNDDAPRFQGGMAPDLERAKRQAEQSYAAGPICL